MRMSTDVMCSICQCVLSREPPEGSTQLADLYEDLKTPDMKDPEIAGQPNIVTTPCGHLFHSSCLTQWFLMIGHRRCPLCNFITPVHQMQRIFPSMQSFLIRSAEVSVECGQSIDNDYDLSVIEPVASYPLTGVNTIIQEEFQGGRDIIVAAEPEPEVETVDATLLPPWPPEVTGTTAVPPPSELSSSGDYTLETDTTEFVSTSTFQRNVIGSSNSQSRVLHDFTQSFQAAETGTETTTQVEIPLQVAETFINGIRTVVYHFNSSASASSVSNNDHQLLRTDFGRERPRARETIRRRQRQRSQPRRSPFSRSCLRCANLSKIQALMTSDLRDLRNLVTEQLITIESLAETLENKQRQEEESSPSRDSQKLTETKVDSD